MQIRFQFFLARLIIYKKPQSGIFIHKHQIIIYELFVTALLVSRGSSSKSILFNKMVPVELNPQGGIFFLAPAGGSNLAGP